MEISNKTNGVTPRRWIRFCNPHLSKIITKWTGTEDWLINTEKLADLRQFADNEELQSEWREAKRSNKRKDVSFLKEKTRYIVNPDAMFDVQVDKKLVKQTVMTSVYAVTYICARDQIKRRLKERNAIADDTELFGAACYAAKITLTALGEMFQAARSIMGWLGDCAKVVPYPL
ncbi:unnamed protein product [Camellia sinensis]